MANIKVIIFQKNINTDITKDQKAKIAAARADFLILPRYYPYFEDPQPGIEERESKYLDRILEISESHRGVVIGGSIFRKQNGLYVESVPIVKDVTLVDYYNYRSDGTVGSFETRAGDGDSFYILHGARFAILPGRDILNQKHLEDLKKEKIELIFNPMDVEASEGDFMSYQNELKKYSEISKNFNLNVIRSSGFGKISGKELSGRSFYTSQTGVKWKLGEQENFQEIIKTVNVNIFENFPV